MLEICFGASVSCLRPFSSRIFSLHGIQIIFNIDGGMKNSLTAKGFLRKDKKWNLSPTLDRDVQELLRQ